METDPSMLHLENCTFSWANQEATSGKKNKSNVAQKGEAQVLSLEHDR